MTTRRTTKKVTGSAKLTNNPHDKPEVVDESEVVKTQEIPKTTAKPRENIEVKTSTPVVNDTYFTPRGYPKCSVCQSGRRSNLEGKLFCPQAFKDCPLLK